MHRRLFLTLAVTAPLLSPPLAAAPRAELWRRWQAQDASAERSVDHSAWQRFLDARLVSASDGINRLDYAAVTPADRALLRGYLDRLAGEAVSTLRREEQRAYWINLYNALTVAVVLEHYPVDSIRDIDVSPGWFADGPWGRKLTGVEGERVSLDDIEHRILRPIWRDPRVHYAVNCAALGCPNLQAQAFTAANTESLLEQAARDYVNHPRGALVREGRLTVSSIYHWFQVDFGGSDASVIAHLGSYARERLAERLRGVARITGHAYDWSLNGLRAEARAVRRHPA